MRKFRLPTVLAVSLLAPAFTLVPLPPGGAHADPVPVESADRQVPLGQPDDAAAGGGGHASTSEVGLARSQSAPGGRLAAQVIAPEVLEVSAPEPVPGHVAVIGVTWTAGTGDATVVQYRVQTAAGWGDWQAVDADGDEQTDAERGASARDGSDPIVLTEATGVQARVLGTKSKVPADAKLTIIDPGRSAADATVGAPAPGAAQAAAARPRIYSRAQWGANESLRRVGPSYGRVKGVVVHHTAGTNNYSQSQVPAILRGIYAFHTKDRGWNDVGYNFLVDKWGRVWEGRFGGTNRALIGAHAAGFNSETMGISVLGDYQRAGVNAAALRSVEQTIAWKAGIHGFTPDAMTTLMGRRLPAVVGHRDVGQTTCPGTSIYNRLPEVRRRARTLMGGWAGPASKPAPPAPAPPAPTTPAATSGVAASDVLMRGSSNALFAPAALGSTGVAYARRVSSRDWSGYDVVLAAGDLDRDGHGDVVARHRATGALHLFRGTAEKTVTGPKVIGSGWRGMRQITAGGDLDGDGIADLAAVDARGQLFRYPGNGRGGLGRAVRVGSGWNAFERVIAVGDWDGDRKGDLLAVTRAGAARLYRGNGTGAFPHTVALRGYYNYPALTGLTGRRALLAVDAAGNGYALTRNAASTVGISRVAPSFRGLHVYDG